MQASATEIVSRYLSGRGAPTLSREFGIGKTSVYRILKGAGISPRDTYREKGWLKKFPPETEEAIVALYSQGKSLSEIAEIYPCSHLTVRNILKRHGAVPNPRGNRYRGFSPEDISAMKRMYANGMSQNAIADAFQTHQTIISRVLRANGIEPKTRAAVGSRHGNWKGGSISIAGYRFVSMPKEHPFRSMAHRNGYVAEHRLVMAEKLGRSLRPEETVHHINGDKLDNNPENLELRAGRHGRGVVCRCADCGSSNIVFDDTGANKANH